MVIQYLLSVVAPLLYYAVAQMEGMPGMEDMMKSPEMQDMMKDPAKMQEMMKMMGGKGGGKGGGMGGMGDLEGMMGGMGGMPMGMGGMPMGMGGMPGMGDKGEPGKGKGEGKPEAPPRKEIGIKTARKFMKEVISTLSTEKAKKQLDEASAVEQDPQKRLQHIGPVVEKMLSGLVEKYKFEAGLAQAMQSVNEAQKRKDDPAVKAALEKFGKIIGTDVGEQTQTDNDAQEDESNEEL